MPIDSPFTDRAVRRFWKQVAKGDGCWLWTGPVQPKGYPYGRMYIRHTTVMAHRMSWALHHGPIPAGKVVCHHCDNPRCVRPDHLFVGTMKDNCVDRDLKGRGRLCQPPRGESHHHAILSAEQVRSIFIRVAAGVSQRSVAAYFGISPSTVNRISRGLSRAVDTAELFV